MTAAHAHGCRICPSATALIGADAGCVGSLACSMHELLHGRDMADGALGRCTTMQAACSPARSRRLLNDMLHGQPGCSGSLAVCLEDRGEQVCTCRSVYIIDTHM